MLNIKAKILVHISRIFWRNLTYLSVAIIVNQCDGYCKAMKRDIQNWLESIVKDSSSSKSIVLGQSLYTSEANKRKPNVDVDERSPWPPSILRLWKPVLSPVREDLCAVRGEQKSNGFTQHDIITIPIVWLKTQTAFLGQAFYEKVNYKIDPFEQTLLLKVM